MRVNKAEEWPKNVILDLKKVQAPFPPSVSVVIPAFNQEQLIYTNLQSLARSLDSNFEIVVVNDCSSDGTEIRSQGALQKIFHDYPSCLRVLLITTKRQAFETLCDSIGFALTSGKYLLEIQADMEINDKGFDTRLIKALDSHQDIFAISGRGVERIAPIVDRYRKKGGADISSSPSILGHVLRRVVFQVSRLVKRGPLPHSTSQFVTPALTTVSHLVFPSEEQFSISGQAGRIGALIDVKLSKSLRINFGSVRQLCGGR